MDPRLFFAKDALSSCKGYFLYKDILTKVFHESTFTKLFLRKLNIFSQQPANCKHWKRFLFQKVPFSIARHRKVHCPKEYFFDGAEWEEIYSFKSTIFRWCAIEKGHFLKIHFSVFAIFMALWKWFSVL